MIKILKLVNLKLKIPSPKHNPSKAGKAVKNNLSYPAFKNNSLKNLMNFIN